MYDVCRRNINIIIVVVVFYANQKDSLFEIIFLVSQFQKLEVKRLSIGQRINY
jgi:hypothetical protein